MKVVSTGNSAYPKKATLKDGSTITLIKQSQLSAGFYKNNSCSLIAESYALQWLGINKSLKALKSWHDKYTPKLIPNKVRICALSACINTLGKDIGSAKYYKTPTATRVKKALKEGRVVLFERANPIHTVTFVPDNGKYYIFNSGKVTEGIDINWWIKHASKSSNHCGMVVVSKKALGNFVDASGDTDVDTAIIEEPPLTFKKRTNPNGRDLHANNKYYKSPLNYQEFNSSTGGNCVWYAYGRFLEVWSEAPASERKEHPWQGSFSQNGWAMVDAAKNVGFVTGTTPKLGAIVSWSYGGRAGGDNTRPGHVAFVENINYDKNGKVTSIEISQSGWSVGDMKNQTLKVGDGKKGLNAYKLTWDNSYFNGFAYNPIPFGKTVNSGNETEYDEIVSGVDFQTRASKLVSSDNYSFVTSGSEEENETTQTVSSTDSFISDFKSKITSQDPIVQPNMVTPSKVSLTELVSDSMAEPYNIKQNTLTQKTSRKTNAKFQLADSVVEAPFIELEISGYKIGSYHGSLDEFPNYVNSLKVSKQNGIINQYQIQLIHQVRAGEDSNLLDELLSTVNYGKIKIRYGDANTGTYFQENEAMVTNVTMNRNYVSMNISYTIDATSEGELIKTYTTNFPAVTDKPSNILRKLIYDSGEISKIILEAFPGMKNRELVESNNLIPTNDAAVSLDAQKNCTVLDYINYVVGNISNKFQYSADFTEDVFRKIVEKENDLLDKFKQGSSKSTNLWMDVYNKVKNIFFGSDSSTEEPTSQPTSSTVEEEENQLAQRVVQIINDTTDTIRNSLYYVTYNDADELNPYGAYLKVTEVKANVDAYAVSNRIYEITVGYPDDLVFDFSVESTDSWELLYKNQVKATEYFYTILDNGDVAKYYSPSISSSTHAMSELSKNWWTQMVRFPVSASLTLRGLMKPIMLMDYVRINVLFYGQQHLVSGVYTITGQTDSLSGSGYRTTLSLVRVGNL